MNQIGKIFSYNFGRVRELTTLMSETPNLVSELKFTIKQIILSIIKAINIQYVVFRLYRFYLVYQCLRK